LAYATIKYNGAGVQQWIARYNGPINGDDKANALVVDGAGNVYVTGSSISIGSSGLAYATIKYNTAGAQQWIARYNGPANGDDQANALAVDGAGNVYVTGSSIESNGFVDYATIKYNSAGAQQGVARYNGPGKNDDQGQSLAIDATGNVYVTGSSIGIGATGFAYATIKYDRAGVQQWVARYDGPINGDDKASALAVDGAGNVYVTGSSIGPTGLGYATIKYSNGGVLQWVVRFNGPVTGDDNANALVVDGAGNVYVTGASTAANGYYDYATIKYPASGASIALAGETSSDYTEFTETDDDDQEEVDENTSLPTTFSLAQNFPNPFNPTTTIRFVLPNAGKVKVTVYNLHGEEVRTLVDGEVAAGYHDVTFDGSDLASGIYFCRLEADELVATQKMLLAK
jgi:hypothetical protein